MASARGSVTMSLVTVMGTTINLGSAVESSNVFIESRAFDMENARFTKFIQYILYNIRDRKGNPNLILELWGSDEEEYGFELMDTIYVSEEDPAYTDPPGKRYWKFIFRDTSVSKRWSIHGFEVWGELGGEEF